MRLENGHEDPPDSIHPAFVVRDGRLEFAQDPELTDALKEEYLLLPQNLESKLLMLMLTELPFSTTKSV